MCAIDIRPAIATERLRLRAPALSDASRVAALAGDFGVAGMTSSIPHPYAEAEARAFLGRAADPAEEATFAIEHPQEGLIGMIGFAAGDPAAGRLQAPELGYWLGRPYWGLGYATEAARAAVGWAAREWRKRIVFASHFVGNPASGEVLCKTGFLYTGDVRRLPSKARGTIIPARTMVWLA